MVVKRWMRWAAIVPKAGMAASGKCRSCVNEWADAFLQDVDEVGWMFVGGMTFVMKNA